MDSARLIRLVHGLLVPLSVTLMAVVPPRVLWGHLPDPLASHFGFSGAPNGSMSRSAAFATTWALAVLASLSVAVSVLRSKRPSRVSGLIPGGRNFTTCPRHQIIRLSAPSCACPLR